MYTTHIWQVRLGGQAGVVTGRKMLENIDEFVQERLALYTHEEVFEVIIVETAGPAAVAPKLHRGHMHIFFSHTVLDSSQAKCARARHPEKNDPPVIRIELSRLRNRGALPMPIEIRRKDVKTLVVQGRAQLVEVLPASEFKREHLPQAVNIPLETMTAATTKSLRKDQAVIVYCFDYQCDLSARAAWRLETMGFQEVYRYTPGKADWLAAGWETEGTDAKKVRIRQMIHKDVPTCSLRERLEDVKSRRRPNQDMCIVVNDRNIVLGVIQGEIWDANPQSRIADVMQPGPRTIRPDLERKAAQKVLKNYDASCAIVTTADGELLGIVKIAQKKAQKARKAA